MIRAASVSDLLFVSTTCVNCIWGFFFGFFFSPKDSLCDKADSSAHSGFNEPPGCRCRGCDTEEACWSALLCQAQQNSIPSSEPLFRLLGRQYVGAFIWGTYLAHTLLCLCVCVCVCVCKPDMCVALQAHSPHQSVPRGALITRLNHVCRKKPQEMTVSQCHCGIWHLHPQTPATSGYFSFTVPLSIMHYLRVHALCICPIPQMIWQQRRAGQRRKWMCSKNQ